jgi:hypothetical protein
MWNPYGSDGEDRRTPYDILEPDRTRLWGAPGGTGSPLWRPGLLLLDSDQLLDDRVDCIVENSYQATGDGHADVIHYLAAALAAWAADLPGSERNHHRAPFGLLDHSLDTAARFMGWAARSPSEDAVRTRWLAVGMALALFHDVGKLGDFTVTAPAGGERWDPFREPLTAFRARHRLPYWNVRDYRWTRGRGAHGHDTRAVDLVDTILPADFTAPFRRDLRAAFEALGCRSPERLKEYPWPLPCLSMVVRRCDRESASFGGSE